MATWIAHLRIAAKLLDVIEELDPAQFLIGNIGPDCNLPDEKWENFTPPAKVTHFGDFDHDVWSCADLDFYRKYLKDQLSSEETKDIYRFSFLIGYFFHLLTDNLYHTKIGKPVQQKFAAEFEKDPGFIWEVKRDWYGLDFIYLRDHPNSIFHRVFLNCEYRETYLEFLTPEGIQQRISYIKEYYQRQDEKIQALYERPYIYLSQASMDTFVEEATEKIFQVYNHIWIKKGAIPNGPTILDYV